MGDKATVKLFLLDWMKKEGWRLTGYLDEKGMFTATDFEKNGKTIGIEVAVKRFLRFMDELQGNPIMRAY